MRKQAHGHLPRRHGRPYFANFQRAVKIHKIYGELHAQTMYSTTGDDPYSLPGSKARSSQQTFSSGRTGVRNLGKLRENAVACLVADQDSFKF